MIPIKLNWKQLDYIEKSFQFSWYWISICTCSGLLDLWYKRNEFSYKLENWEFCWIILKNFVKLGNSYSAGTLMSPYQNVHYCIDGGQSYDSVQLGINTPIYVCSHWINDSILNST